jgi:hypothetical protein
MIEYPNGFSPECREAVEKEGSSEKLVGGLGLRQLAK